MFIIFIYGLNFLLLTFPCLWAKLFFVLFFFTQSALSIAMRGANILCVQIHKAVILIISHILPISIQWNPSSVISVNNPLISMYMTVHNNKAGCMQYRSQKTINRLICTVIKNKIWRHIGYYISKYRMTPVLLLNKSMLFSVINQSIVSDG